MSYLRKRYGTRRAPAPMGDVTSTVTTLISAAGVANDLANDPYLPETMCHVGQLKAINAGQKPGVCVPTKPGLKGGLGLGRFQPALRAYVYAEQHPWVYGAAVVGVIGLPMLIGYALGRTSK